MKIGILFLSLSILVLFLNAFSRLDVEQVVNPNGKTEFKFNTVRHSIEVEIQTQELKITNPSDGIDAILYSKCTRSRIPCSLLIRIDISVNGKKLFIPRSAYLDLADIHHATIVENETYMTILFRGGDASESYIAKIDFNENRVLKRSIASGLIPEKLLESTQYYEVIIGD